MRESGGVALDVGTSTYPFLWECTLLEALERISRIGVKNVEILVSPPHLSFRTLTMDDVRQIKKKVRDENLNVRTLNIPGLDINIASVFPEMRDYTVDQYKQLIRLAAQLEAPYILMHPGKLHPLLPPDFERVWEMCRPCYEEVVRFAESHGVVVLIENMPSLFFQTAEEIKRALNEIGSGHFAAAYDVSNAFMVEDPAEGIRTLGNAIRVLHLNDTSRQKWAHNPVGENDIDFRAIGEALREIDFTGECILEIIPAKAEEGILSSISHLRKAGWHVN